MKREIIVNGLRYYLGSTDRWAPAAAKGFGGRQYTVRFHDGEIVRTDDLNWDYTFRTRSKSDTAIILEGWNATAESPRCGWRPAGDHQVFGPIEALR